MNITKLNLTNRISKKMNIHKDDGLFSELGFYYIGPIDGHNLDHLLPILRNIKDIIAYKNVKISKFGTFKEMTTVERVGRNPRTMQTHIIPSKKKIIFNASKNVREELN